MQGIPPPRRFYFGKLIGMDALSKYFRDTFAELRQVAWPTQSQALKYTVLVVVISTFVALFVALFDYVFSLGINSLVSRF
jgi:preprotein translocase SecE subunit